jgi:ribosomal protein S18 acetylase RimI-like enzyme
MKDKKSKLTIRKAIIKDTESLAQHNILLAKETEYLDLDPETVTRGVKAIIKDPHKGFFLVAECNGEIAGQLMVTYEWSDWRNKNFLWIQRVYVPEKYRQQGIFTSLYHYLEDFAHYRKNVTGLRLYVEMNNEKAQQTYERLGLHNAGYYMYEVLL